MVLPFSAQRLITEVDQLFARAGTQSDLQVQADYAQYLVVRVSGLMERAAEEVVLAFTQTQSSERVATHVAWRMKVFQNPEVKRFVTLMKSFSTPWAEQFETALTTEEREAIGSVRANRNKIAHGEPTAISLGQINGFYGQIKTALDKFAAPF